MMETDHLWQPGLWNDRFIECIPVSDEDDRHEWQKIRSSLIGIGGSEAGAILGLNDYVKPWKLFYQKIGYLQKDFKPNDYSWAGHFLEDKIRQAWMLWDGKNPKSHIQNYYDGVEPGILGRKVVPRKEIMRNPDYPWLFMNIDGEITEHPDYDKSGIWEGKTIKGSVVQKWEHGFPIYYVVQVNHYMLLPDTEYAELCLLEDGKFMHYVPFERSASLQEIYLDATYKFMQKVWKGIEIMENSKPGHQRDQWLDEIAPDPNGDMDYNEFVSKQFKQYQERSKKIMPPSVWEDARELEKIKGEIVALEKRKSDLDARIKLAMKAGKVEEFYKDKNNYIRWKSRLTIKISEP